MSFDEKDYARAAKLLPGTPVAHIKAVAQVESAGETFWVMDSKLVVPVRFEAHWFGKLTGYKFNASHPDLSCIEWNPSLAARTRAGAWGQLLMARTLDTDAANAATSWGAFQIMGFHWRALGYPSVRSFVDSMSTNGDDGQIDAFIKFIKINPVLERALREGDFDTFEKGYNGGGYGGSYAAKMRAAVASLGGEAGGLPRTLRLGDEGPDVAALQRAIGVPVDGQFGPQTETAVRRVQEDHGLVVDGKVGAMTRSIIGH